MDDSACSTVDCNEVMSTLNNVLGPALHKEISDFALKICNTDIYPKEVQVTCDEAVRRSAVVSGQALRLGISDTLLRNPLPLDSTGPSPINFPQLLVSRGSKHVEFAEQLQCAQCGGDRARTVIVASAATGVGKTHLAFQWGLDSGFAVIASVVKRDVSNDMTEPFAWLTERLRELRSFASRSKLPHDERRSKRTNFTQAGAGRTSDSQRNGQQLVAKILSVLWQKYADYSAADSEDGGLRSCTFNSALTLAYDESVCAAVSQLTKLKPFLLAVDEAHELMTHSWFNEISDLVLPEAVEAPGVDSHATLTKIRENRPPPRSLDGKGGLSAASLRETVGRTRSLYDSLVCTLAKFGNLDRWSVYVTGTRSCMRFFQHPTSASVNTRCEVRPFSPGYHMTAEDMVQMLTHYYNADELFRSDAIREKLKRFEGRPVHFEKGVWTPLFSWLRTEKCLPTVEELQAELDERAMQRVQSWRNLVIRRLNKNTAIARYGSGTLLFVPKLVEAVLMRNGEFAFDKKDDLDCAIKEGFLPIHSETIHAATIDIKAEPIMFDAIRETALHWVERELVLSILLRSAREIAVDAKGGALEIAISWHVALTSLLYAHSKKKPLPLTYLLATMGGPQEPHEVCESAHQWEVRITQVVDYAKTCDKDCGFACFLKDGEIDDTIVVYNTPRNMGVDIMYLVSRPVSPDMDDDVLCGTTTYRSSATHGGASPREFRLVVKHCKIAEKATAADILLTLHPACQFLQNATRRRLLGLPDVDPKPAAIETPSSAWEQWAELSKDTTVPFLYSRWIRVPVVARPVHSDIHEFSTNVSEIEDTPTWTAEEREAAFNSPVVWVNFAEDISSLCLPGAFPEDVRSSLVERMEKLSEVTLLHKELWIPRGFDDAISFFAPKNSLTSDKARGHKLKHAHVEPLEDVLTEASATASADLHEVVPGVRAVANRGERLLHKLSEPPAGLQTSGKKRAAQRTDDVDSKKPSKRARPSE